MKRALVLLLLATTAQAGERAGVTMPDTLTVDDNRSS